MALIWSELSNDADRERRSRFESEAEAMWSRLASKPARAAVRLGQLDERLSIVPCGMGWQVCYEERAARSLAELVVGAAPRTWEVRVGQEPEPHGVALARARAATGVALEGTRVRVGLSRGHLLEIVFSVPLDVAGDEEQLQLAAEIFAENVVGERLLDDWVGSVEVTRGARQRGLLVFQEPSPSTTYELEQTCELVRRGVEGIFAALPESLLVATTTSWTALEFAAAAEALQPERSFASTRVPEALKAALEGLPFHSGRFTRGEEVFVWLEWGTEGLSPERRRALRDSREGALLQSFAGTSTAQLVGSGFGLDRDYLDLVVSREPRVLAELVELVLAAGPERGAIEVGFYDSVWSEERLIFV